MNAKDWTTEYAHRLGIEPPSSDEFKAILDLAAEAAHAAERVAAPVACWLGAKADRPLEELLRLAREVGADAPNDRQG